MKKKLDVKLINKNMEENKYYTPSIEEFHVGFEYNRLVAANEFIDGSGWMSVKFPDPFTGSNIYSIEKNIDTVRVKYLDKEDIESLGFTCTWEKIKPYGNYYSFKKEETEIWYSMLKTNMPNIPYLIIKTKKYNSNCRVNLKNKSELKDLLKKLNITD